MTRSGLQIRMTVFVTSAVLLVSAIVLAVMMNQVRGGLERAVDERLSDDLSAITKVIGQRLLRIEESAATMASISAHLSADPSSTDSLLCRALVSTADLASVSIALNGGAERTARMGDDRKIVLSSSSGTVPEYVSGWNEPVKDATTDTDILRYCAPINGTNGERTGIVCYGVPVGRITSFVTDYKARTDIDISVFNRQGTMIVAPDDYIFQLRPEDLLTKETVLERLRWTVRLSADSDIISSAIRNALLSLIILILLMFAVIVLAIVLTVRYVAKPFITRQLQTEKEKSLMENEMQLAATAQNELLPHVFPPFPERKGIEISACLYPARDVGGDLYDYFISGNRLYFCIGDVSGKGVPASLFMAATHYLFRSAAAGMPAAEAAMQMNRALCNDNEQCRFVTFWFGILDLGSGELEYVNAGHDAPVLIRGRETLSFPPSPNMPFGAFEEEDYISSSTTLQPGDRLLLYTDGVTEAMNTEGHAYTRKKLLEALGQTTGTGTSGIIGTILEKVRQHASGAEQSDDITMLCIKFIKNEIQ